MATVFDLDKKRLVEIFREKGIENLYHANTIGTAISFLNQKALLSRKYITDNGLFQTEQYSDAKDQQFNIWDGIFLDSMDIHTEFRRRNLYGPLLFSFDINLLNSEYVNNVRITKINPVHWNPQQSEKDWYYSDLDEFRDKYKKGNKAKDIGSMIILNDINGRLPLQPFLNKFILDNPNVLVNYKEKETYLTEIIVEKLKNIITQNEFQNVPRELRHQNVIYNCNCWTEYKNLNQGDLKILKKLFHPTAGI